MANTLSVIDMVTRESLRIAHEKLSFIGTIDRSYDSSFAKSGAKIGDTLRVRNPNQYVRRQGSRIMNVQDQAETTQNVVVATQDGVDMKFNSAELKLSIDELSRRYIEPAVSVMVSGIESDVLQGVTKDVYQLTGTAGEIVGAVDLDAVSQARAKLNKQLAPKDNNRSIQVDSVTMASIANGTKTGSLFHDGPQISKLFREGYLGRFGGTDFYENDRTYAHTVGADVTTVTLNDGSIASGDTTVTIAGGTVAVGDVFTIVGVFDVHPETKAAYSSLKQFTVTAGAGTNNITFSPAWISTGAKQNVNELPTTGDALVFYGSASTAYQQSLMYHKDAFTFVNRATLH